jgi:hypothetical protein
MMARSGTADEVRNRAKTKAAHRCNPRYHPMYHLPSLYDILHTPNPAKVVKPEEGPGIGNSFLVRISAE